MARRFDRRAPGGCASSLLAAACLLGHVACAQTPPPAPAYPYAPNPGWYPQPPPQQQQPSYPPAAPPYAASPPAVPAYPTAAPQPPPGQAPWPQSAPPAYAAAQAPGTPSQWPPYPPPGSVPPPPPTVQAQAEAPAFIFRPYFGLSSVRVSLLADEDPDVVLVPNSSTALGLRAGYGPFVGSASIGVGTAEDPVVYGKSSSLDFGLSSTTKVGGHEVMGTVFFQQYRNFYAENMDELGIDPAHPYRLPDMKLRSFGVAATFFTDPNFSYDDTFLECRVRPTSEATWAFRVALGYLSFDSGGQSLVPPDQADHFGKAAQVSSLDSRYASASIGWASDWRLGAGFYIGMNGMLGLTASARVAKLPTEKLIEPAFGPQVTLHLILGYAGDTFHWGSLTTVDLESETFDDTTLAASRVVSTLFVGVRF